MRKLLLLTTALVGFAALPVPVQAAPLATLAALIGNGVGFGAAISATFGALGAAVLKIGGSLLLSTIATALQGRPKQEVQRAELTRPTALPAYRYVYGRCWAPGTPLGWEIVGNILYICYLLNSRPSSLTDYTVLLDKRAVTLSGDPFDFTSGGGAVPTNDPFTGHLKVWIGRGSQTTCPATIASESGFSSADAWQGRTVLWARMDCGAQAKRSERLPSNPPELNVEGDWSLVYDPRDGLTKFSRNQALIVLDALRTNPLKPYADTYLSMETFEWGADAAGETVPVNAGGTIRRYRCDGVLVWSDGAELEDQIAPLEAAGASRLVRVGGKLAFVPAIWRDPVHTITDFTDGQPIEMTRWAGSDDLYTECVARYTAPDRAYETAEAPVYVVPGAQAADGGLAKRLDLPLDYVIDHRQAQRLAKIAVMRSRMQRRISGELFPDAFLLVAASRADVDLPAPLTPFNGAYEVEMINPSAGINDDDSITLRLPVALRETSSAVYAWTAATEEQEVEGAILSASVARVQAPASITVVSGSTAAIVSGSTITARVRAEWPASTSASALAYEWEWRREATTWQAGGRLDVDAARVAYVVPVWIDDDYEVRVRTIGLYGSSSWRTSSVVVASGPTIAIDAASIRTATGGAGQVALVLDQADDDAPTKIEVWRATVNDVASASLITSRSATANVTVNWTNTGLAAGTYYFWARARDGFGNVSAYSAVKSATAT